MRELDFLPDWYPLMRRRTRTVVVQAWMTFAMALVMCLWMVLMQSSVRHERQVLDKLSLEVKESREERGELDSLSTQEIRLRQQDQTMHKLGLQVEPSRLLKTIDSAMSRATSLLDVQMEVVKDTDAAPAAQTRLNAAAPPPERRLKIKLHGVAPTNVDCTTLESQLSNIPFLDQVAITYAKERSENGHVMREFEVTFSMNLDHVVGAAPDAISAATGE